MLNETGACHSFTPLPVRNYSTMGEMVMPFSPRRREQSDGENCWCDSGGKSGNSLDHQWTIREGHPDPHRMRKSDLSKSATGRSAGPLRVTRTKCHRTLIRTPVPDVVLPCNARRLFDRLRVPALNAAYSRDHRCFRPVRLERHWACGRRPEACARSNLAWGAEGRSYRLLARSRRDRLPQPGFNAEIVCP